MKKLKTVFVFAFLLFLDACSAHSARISGQVLVDGNPYPDAVVRIQTTDMIAVTDQNGSFNFKGLPANEPHQISAWAHGFYIAGGQPIQAGTEDLVILCPWPITLIMNG